MLPNSCVLSRARSLTSVENPPPDSSADDNLLPLSKRRRVAEWDELGLEPMVETEPLSDPDTGEDSGAGTSEDEEVLSGCCLDKGVAYAPQLA